MIAPIPQSATAIAHSNIALAKYWGKADVALNMPAVPSLSMTLDGLFTETTVSFDAHLAADEVHLDGRPASAKELRRVVSALDLVRQEAGFAAHARVSTRNNFPTASGLASSASGFAALILAARAACGLPDDREASSALARRCSASAARSLYGGYVMLELGAPSAKRLHAPEGFALELLVAVTDEGPKPIGSTEGMDLTRQTSPYYAAWVDAAPALFNRAKAAIEAGDFGRLGPIIEQSALLMHASMMGADPAIVYFTDTTLRVFHAVRSARQNARVGFCTMDAGPHVKVLTLPSHAMDLQQMLQDVPGVKRVIHCRLGPDARVEVQGAR